MRMRTIFAITIIIIIKVRKWIMNIMSKNKIIIKLSMRTLM